MWPERTYTVKRQHHRSVDWIVELDEAVVLIEAKSTRPDDSVRRGAEQAAQYLRSRLSDALKQVDRTAELIRDRHHMFTDVPNDRPVIGIVVTIESFHSINAPFVREWLPKAETPTTFCSIYELELAVTVHDQPGLGSILLDLLSSPDKRGWSVGPTLVGRDLGRNTVLDAAWNSYPWVSGARERARLRSNGN